jgi:hypothetical protein
MVLQQTLDCSHTANLFLKFAFERVFAYLKTGDATNGDRATVLPSVSSLVYLGRTNGGVCTSNYVASNGGIISE